MTDKLAKKQDEALSIPGLEGMVTTTRPAGADTGTLGSEGIGKEDITLPRLALVQKTSPEIDPTSPRYIEGAQFTDLFNSVSKRVYGKGPIYFSILRRDNPRWVEFRPLDEGGGIIDPNVPANDPRTQFGPIDPATRKSEPPIATKFYDFVVLVLNDLNLADPMQNIVGLSMKSTALKVAKQLNLLITQRGKKALYKGVYEMRTASDSNASGAFAVYKVKNAGWLAPGSIVETLAAESWESWKDREVKIDLETVQTREPGDEDFPPSTDDAKTEM